MFPNWGERVGFVVIVVFDFVCFYLHFGQHNIIILMLSPTGCVAVNDSPLNHRTPNNLDKHRVQNEQLQLVRCWKCPAVFAEYK